MTTDEMDGMQPGESRTDLWKQCQRCAEWTHFFGGEPEKCAHCGAMKQFDPRSTISGRTFDATRAKAATAKLKRKIARKR